MGLIDGARDWLDVRQHGRVLFTTYDGSPMARRVHEDGYERLYKKAPLAPRYACVRCAVKSNERSGQLCYQCRGDDRLTPRQVAYLAAVTAEFDGTFPHCDANILHSADKCSYCARAIKLVGLRYRYDIAFSGEDNPDFLGLDPCPSTAYRSENRRDRWPGNRAQ